MKKLNITLIALCLVALATSCRLGKRHTQITENGNGQDLHIEYIGTVYFNADSTGIKSLSPGSLVKYKNHDQELVTEADYRGRITYKINDGDEQRSLSGDDRKFMAVAVKDMIKHGHYNDGR